MEPITTAIVAAVTAGAAAGATKVGENVLVDAYTGIKALITKKFGKKSEDVADAIERVEKRPDSEGRKATLQEELVRVGADQDPEVLHAAKLLTTAVQEYVTHTGVTGVDLEKMKAAALKIEDVIAVGARSTGVKAKEIIVAGDVEITGVRAGQPDPNA